MISISNSRDFISYCYASAFFPWGFSRQDIQLDEDLYPNPHRDEGGQHSIDDSWRLMVAPAPGFQFVKIMNDKGFVGGGGRC